MGKGLLTAIFLMAPCSALAQSAPFCMFGPMGTQCHYYSMDVCQQLARGTGGVCAPNQQSVPQAIQQQMYPAPQIYVPQVEPLDSFMQGANAAESIMRAGEDGARARRARQESEARLKTYEAQQAAYEAQQQLLIQQASAQSQVQMVAQPEIAGSKTLYKCRRPDGTALYTSNAEPGCIVVGNYKE
jgi:hypothetical protein